jgi:hypothetical protein
MLVPDSGSERVPDMVVSDAAPTRASGGVVSTYRRGQTSRGDGTADGSRDEGSSGSRRSPHAAPATANLLKPRERRSARDRRGAEGHAARA